ncbi:signal peptide peptidase A. Serine peptidase. MEROPS family S49 [Devosia lucknowensis]|uniref:Signal peptide peptidase A. Serine peptidase. MEROPS family S49 n=1 Tax=Devosia lucknowensis TaxID=1096929 RepID=A0A1Y6GAU4_9HYPH|nr:signal peptide peptidase SppA [Devosia lucknowensis]SMQ85848.1 signal peptide peptidase A. Serine peptidase. MEROPS family S49 [Devosia lucknowensis]
MTNQMHHDILAADRYRRSRGLWRILALVAAVIAILALVGRFALPDQVGGDRIARIVVSGTIMTDAARSKVISELIEDDAIKAVIVAINSPGGTTAGGEELYDDLRRLSAAKPVVSTIDELGASAAYMTAIATDHIFARRLSIVGSIGVLYQHVNAGKLLDTIGVDLDKVASGPLKAEPDFNEPLEGAPRQSITELVEDSFAWFVDIVAERRGLTRPQTLALADGRIMTGRAGVETGLIDATGGEFEALAWLESERGVDKDTRIVTVWPPQGNDFGWVGNLLGTSMRSAIGLPAESVVMLDGLVSLWQVAGTP